jgi:hypothetical protein
MPRMKSPRRFLTTPHQRQRLALWALAMLSWIAAVLFAGKEITHRQLRQRYRVSVESLTRMVIHLILLRARELSGLRPRKLRFWKHGRDLRTRHLIRSVVGSKLRRALKHKDPAMRIARLIGALHNLDAYAQHLAQRFRRRLTRLWAIVPAPTFAALLLGPPAPPPAVADSS